MALPTPAASSPACGRSDEGLHGLAVGENGSTEGHVAGDSGHVGGRWEVLAFVRAVVDLEAVPAPIADHEVFGDRDAGQPKRRSEGGGKGPCFSGPTLVRDQRHCGRAVPPDGLGQLRGCLRSVPAADDVDPGHQAEGPVPETDDDDTSLRLEPEVERDDGDQLGRSGD